MSLTPDFELTAEDLRDYVKERVAACKYPRQVWVLDDLPKGPTGKIQKRDLKLPLQQGRGCERQRLPRHRGDRCQ